MMRMRFLTSAVAQQIDRDLMSPSGGFSVEQLMELAGLSCAEAVYKTYPPTEKCKHVFVACGPGNQGGDGLVAARHLFHFGYIPTLENISVRFVENDTLQSVIERESHLVLDSIFGFSFHGEPREPFRAALELLIQAQKERKLPILSVDIPSSWNVDEGQSTSDIARRFNPNVLISLTAPKLGVRGFSGEKHWLGGRFVDPDLSKKYDLQLPKYPNTSQVVDITGAEPLTS